MRRIRELVAEVSQRHPNDHFFDGLEQTIRESGQARRMYSAYDRALCSLDSASWNELKQKSIRHFLDHRPGQLKQGFFNQINDAFAYQHLVNRGHTGVRILPESGKTTPDIEYFVGGGRAGCEVKTLGISDELIKRRESMQPFFGPMYEALSSGYLVKLSKTVRQAREQILSNYSTGLVYLVAHFDDFTMTHYSNYRRQLKVALATHVETHIYVKVGLLGNRRIESCG